MEAVGGHKKGFKLLRSNSEAIARRARRGFNLIEAAIVLGVVGLVIGGIWVGAATVKENWKAVQLQEEIRTTVRSIQDFIPVTNAFIFSDGQMISPVVWYAGILPDNWTYTPLGGVIKTVSGSILLLYSYKYTGSPFFSIRIPGVPKSQCIKLLLSLSSSDGLNLYYINVQYPNWGTNNFPINQDIAEMACNLQINEVRLFYYYTRIN